MKFGKKQEDCVVEAVVTGSDAEVLAPEEAVVKPEEMEAVDAKKVKKQSRIATASFVWTILSMIFAIVSAGFYLYKQWLLAPYSYIMFAVLGVYIVVFAVMVGLYAGNAKQGKKKIKGLKKTFGIFRTFTTLVFLIVTAVSMTGVVSAKGLGLWQWIVLGVNISVAIVQISLKISSMVFSAVVKKIGKKYTVRITSYVNGVAKENKVQTKVMSKLYGTEITADEKKPLPAATAEPAPAPADGTPSVAANKTPRQTAREELKIAAVKYSKEVAKEQVAKAVAKIEKAKAQRAAGKSGEPQEKEVAAVAYEETPAAVSEPAKKSRIPLPSVGRKKSYK